MADLSIRRDAGTVLPGGLLVVDIHTFVVLDEVRALKQGAGQCHIVLTGRHRGGDPGMERFRAGARARGGARKRGQDGARRVKYPPYYAPLNFNRCEPDYERCAAEIMHGQNLGCQCPNKARFDLDENGKPTACGRHREHSDG